MATKNAEAYAAAEQVADYEHGWSSDIETDFAPKGLTEDTVRFISAKKDEPQWRQAGFANLASASHLRAGRT